MRAQPSKRYQDALFGQEGGSIEPGRSFTLIEPSAKLSPTYALSQCTMHHEFAVRKNVES